SAPVRDDVRAIAATTRDLEHAAPRRRLSERLYYPLRASPIHVPPLRERPDAIPLLVPYRVVEKAAAPGRRVDRVPRPTPGAPLAATRVTAAHREPRTTRTCFIRIVSYRGPADSAGGCVRNNPSRTLEVLPPQLIQPCLCAPALICSAISLAVRSMVVLPLT